MTLRTLIRRSLRHHWRAHLGVTLGAAIGSAALIGALVVGDSVRESLRRRALERLGHVWAAMNMGDRFLSRNTAVSMRSKGIVRSAGAQQGCSVWLQLRCSVARADGASRANAATLLATDELKDFGLPGGIALRLATGTAALNTPLAKQLGVQAGDEIIVRVPKATSFSREAALAPRSDDQVAVRLRVAEILPSPTGDFSLLGGSRPIWNVFVNRDELAGKIGLPGRANLVLAGPVCVGEEVGRFRHFFRQLLNWSSNKAPNPFSDFAWFRFPFGNAWPLSSEQAAAEANEALADHWKLADAQCELRDIVAHADQVELRTPRVFLDPPIIRAALAADTNAQPLLTYLANLLQAGTNATPYSMITAAGPPWTPADLPEDEILISQWLADDLRVKAGDEVALSYFDPESGARLVERTNTFRVRGIAPMGMPWADRTLMPDFPGIEKAESTSDWEAGFPLTYKIRQKDEDYWKQFRGTPKAFVTLAAGQKMWGNRFGNLTAIRFPIPTNATTALIPALSPGERANRSPVAAKAIAGESPGASEKSSAVQRLLPLPGGEGRGEGEHQTNLAEDYCAALEKRILANLKPEELGLRFEPVREQALKAAAQSQDFGGLFLGFSFFLIAAALLLMAMLFQLGLEQRAPEIGTLLALGFTPREVRKLLLGEGAALAFFGGVVGALGGWAYAKAMLHGLATIWQDAVGATSLDFHVTAQTLAIGLFASVIVSAVTIGLALRKFLQREPRELLAGEVTEAGRRARERAKGGWHKFRLLTNPATKAWLALLAGLLLVGWMLARGDTANAGAFFGAGALVLIAGLSFMSAWLASVLRASCSQNHLSTATSEPHLESDLPAGHRRHVSLSSLGLRGCARRQKRSLATVAMLACGSFLIVSIGVFRLDANRDATQRRSGTGGFALIGETTMPVVQDLNSPSGRDFFALKEEDLKGVSFVPFRVREGDEASCLNLNRAQKPRLLGAKPELLEGRFAFAKGEAWQSLKSETGNRTSQMTEVPAIGDAASIQWAMGKKVGDTLDYVDERGQPFKVRIVGAVANSILQGQLIIDEAEFVKRFPGESGYRQFLIDAPTNRITEVSTTLSRAMQDAGLELTPAAQRLAQFNAVQNTYLGTFQVLGGLGLLLGSVGLGIVVLRNALERRGELAVLLAVGFRKPTLQRLLLIENGALLALGLAVGVIAAAVAVVPALLSPGTQLPWLTLALTLAAVLLNGALWTWAATRYAVRGDLLAALRNE